jgi:hypothetical protein
VGEQPFSVGCGGPLGFEHGTQPSQLSLRRSHPLTGFLGALVALLGPGRFDVPGRSGSFALPAGRDELSLKGGSGGVRCPTGFGRRNPAQRGGHKPADDSADCKSDEQDEQQCVIHASQTAVPP